MDQGERGVEGKEAGEPHISSPRALFKAALAYALERNVPIDELLHYIDKERQQSREQKKMEGEREHTNLGTRSENTRQKRSRHLGEERERWNCSPRSALARGIAAREEAWAAEHWCIERVGEIIVIKYITHLPICFFKISDIYKAA